MQIGAADSSPLYSEQDIIGAFQPRFLHLLDRPPPGAQKYDRLHDAVMLPQSKIGMSSSFLRADSIIAVDVAGAHRAAFREMLAKRSAHVQLAGEMLLVRRVEVVAG